MPNAQRAQCHVDTCIYRRLVLDSVFVSAATPTVLAIAIIRTESTIWIRPKSEEILFNNYTNQIERHSIIDNFRRQVLKPAFTFPEDGGRPVVQKPLNVSKRVCPGFVSVFLTLARGPNSDQMTRSISVFPG